MNNSKFKILISFAVVFLIIACSINEDEEITEKYVPPFGMNLVYEADLNNHEMRDKAQSAGVQWSREVFLWEHIEFTEGNFDFSGYDEIVQDANSRNINILGVLAYSTPWLNYGNAPSNENHFEKFANYAYTVMNRYKNSIKYWEVWNEPDLAEYWQPEPSPYDYTQLLKHTYNKAKSISSDIKILGFGSDPGNLDFINEMFLNDALIYMDIFSIHPYSYPIPFEISYQNQTINSIKNKMTAQGKEIPFWTTEMGFPTFPNNSSVQEVQANHLVRSYITLLSKGVQNIFWYALINDPEAEDYESQFGLLNSDLTEKTAFSAYSNLSENLTNFQLKNSYTFHDSIKFAVFIKGQETVSYIWSINENYSQETGEAIDSYPYTVIVDFSGTISSTEDIYGTPAEIDIHNEYFIIEADNSPKIIKGNYKILGINLDF